MSATLEQIDTEEIRAAEPADLRAYVDGVIDGSIISCRFVRLAVQRYIKDLDNGAERGLFFDVDEAEIALRFYPATLKHSKGKWGKHPFVLEPWQKFIVWNLFGWKKESNSKRRFNISYAEVGRKNGKSTFVAGTGLKCLVLDGEPGAEIYSAATKMDQAKIIHTEAVRMVRKSPDLKKYLQIYTNNIVMPSTESKYEPLGADAKTLDGLNPHFASLDEFHAHKSGEIHDVLRSAMGSREQWLLFIITTAGFNIHGVCHDEHDYAIKVLENIVTDDSYFAFICTVDDEENWRQKAFANCDTSNCAKCTNWKTSWVKANPNLGVTVDIDDMKAMCKKAQESPGEMNSFLCKKLNIWTAQETKFINMEAWDKCGGVIDANTLLGKPCLAAIDMSSTKDLTANLKLFDLPDGRIFIKTNFYCPKDTAIQRSREDKVPYLKWAEQGWLTLTPGNVVDNEFVRRQIRQDWQDYDVEAMAYDKWGFESNRQELVKPTDGAKGLDEKKIIEFPQTIGNMSEPTKEVERNILSGKYVHNNNPVLTWMINNVAVYTDPNENIRPVKNKSSERIDGFVALVMATGLRLKMPAEIDRDENLREVGI
jgi:phage terminase large subunit-like protein